VAGEGGASIEPRVPSSGALRTEAATVAPVRGVFLARSICSGSVRSWVLDRGFANFLELRLAELRRILLPRTPVNKGLTNFCRAP
jgi:hypothetical protein